MFAEKQEANKSNVISKLTQNEKHRELLKKLTSLDGVDINDEEALKNAFSKTIDEYADIFNEKPIEDNTIDNQEYTEAPAIEGDIPEIKGIKS